MAILGLNLPQVPGLDFDHFGLHFRQFLLSNFGFRGWILAILGLNLPQVPGLDFDHFGLHFRQFLLSNFGFRGWILALSAVNLPALDFDPFGLHFGQFLLSNFGFRGWILAISGGLEGGGLEALPPRFWGIHLPHRRSLGGTLQRIGMADAIHWGQPEYTLAV